MSDGGDGSPKPSLRRDTKLILIVLNKTSDLHTGLSAWLGVGVVPTWRLLLQTSWFRAWTRASVKMLHCGGFSFNGIAKIKPVLDANTEDVLVALDQMIAFYVVRCNARGGL